MLPISSCSNDDNTDEIVTQEERLVLTADKIELNILEVTDLRPRVPISIFTLFDRFDSIRWGIPNVQEEKYIAKQGILTGNMSVGFCLPGTYDAVIRGYRNGEVAESDTLKIRCYSDGDFLSIKWDNNETPGGYAVGGYNNFVQNYHLGLTHIKGENPYAHLKYEVGALFAPVPRPETDAKKQRAESRLLLYDYITDLYGTPAYEYKGDDFVHALYLGEYKKRFSVALNGLGLGITYTPIVIWDTPKSHIVLLGAVDNDKQESYHYYTVIAEPRKF